MGVVSFAEAKRERSPHLQGEAHCIGCAHVWQAVVESLPYRERLAEGEPWLECPNCHAMKGLYTYTCCRPGDHWECKCGNTLFGLTRTGIYCPNCGAWSDWAPEPPVKSVS